MELIHEVAGIECVGFPRPRGPTPDVDPASGALFADDHGTARSGIQIVSMPYFDVLDVAESYLLHAVSSTHIQHDSALSKPGTLRTSGTVTLVVPSPSLREKVRVVVLIGYAALDIIYSCWQFN